MQIDLREIPVVWINLDKATENAKLMEQRLKKFGFKNSIRKSALVIDPPPNTHPAIRHFMGCGKSHIEILVNKNIPTPLLILEDDIEFIEPFNPILDFPDDVDGVYLGVSHGNIHYKSQKYNKNYLRIAGVLATHAILYINPMYREIMAQLGNHCLDVLKQPWDMVTAHLQNTYKVITPNNPMVYQSDNRESANKWEGLTNKPLENRNSNFNDNI
jgi:hypothetical protein